MSLTFNSLGIWNAYNDCKTNFVDPTNQKTCLQSYLLATGLIFDVFSIFGAFLIILTYWAYPTERTRARLFLLFIAIADFFTAVFYAFALTWSLIDNKYSSCTPNKTSFQLWSCIFQSFLDLYFPLASFFWTVILGLHIIFLYTNKSYFKRKPIFAGLLLIGWGVPFVISFTAFIMNSLGPGPPTTSAGWCFINYNLKTGGRNFHWLLEFVFGKMWDLFALMIVAILYPLLFIRVYFLKHRSNIKVSGPDLKLILIPCVFLLLRIWGDIRWVIETGIEIRKGIEPNATCGSGIEKALAFAQVIGDPGQGWANAVVFLLFTQSIRVRMYASVLNFFKKIRGFFQGLSCVVSPLGERKRLINV